MVHESESKHGLYRDLWFRTFSTLNWDPGHFCLLEALLGTFPKNL